MNVTTQAITIEPITGRYMRLEIHGRPHRLYWEEAGSGIPLLCLHTAGSDGRQFRALLNDPAITNRFRVVVFDMPWHGKSSPPEGWEREEYKLTTDAYVELIVTVARALGLERPVAMGCSIGGRVVLELARAVAAAGQNADSRNSLSFDGHGMPPLGVIDSFGSQGMCARGRC